MSARDELVRVTVFRVQDREGRGPYRPGFSKHWVDYDADVDNPTIFQDFGLNFRSMFRPGEGGGCAFRTQQQARDWFTPIERVRLANLGYHLHIVTPDRIVAEAPRQLLIASRLPFNLIATPTTWADLHQGHNPATTHAPQASTQSAASEAER